jgi:5-hydroxyisourate hydrolase
MSRPPITCHILDTLTGAPAPNVPVFLTLLSPAPSSGSSISFQASTNGDGRITSWSSLETPSPELSTLEKVFGGSSGEMMWACKFDTRSYFEDKGIRPFFPEVEIRFLTEGFGDGNGEGKHWHVPLLLGPYSYTTYRGS